MWHFLPVQEWLRALDAWIDSMGVLGGALYAALYVVASLVFVPGSILTAVAGYIFGFAGALAVVFAGTTAAAAAGFLIARYLARRPVERLAKRSQKLGTIDEAVRRTGWKMVGLLRIAAIVPFSVLNYLFGLSSVKFVPYLAATAVGMLPGTFIYAYLGASGKSASEEGGFGPLQWALLAVAVLVTVVMTAVVARFTKKHLKER